jgi:hypothetical protein
LTSKLPSIIVSQRLYYSGLTKSNVANMLYCDSVVLREQEGGLL